MWVTYMESNSEIDFEAIKVVLETTDVFVVRFSHICLLYTSDAADE